MWRDYGMNTPSESSNPAVQRAPAEATERPTPATDDQRRVSPTVALRVFEVIQRLDRPSEILEDEDPSLTMPRRLGLSEVVDRQIKRYGEAVRRRERLSDSELFELVQLVIRRPDASDVFYQAGESLASSPSAMAAVGARLLPEAAGLALARRRVGRGLRRLFGRRIGGFAANPFTLEGRSLLFWQADPSGHACAFVTGFCQGVFDGTLGSGPRVVHSHCEARGDDRCRWTITAEVRSRAVDPASVADLFPSPEPEAG